MSRRPKPTEAFSLAPQAVDGGATRRISRTASRSNTPDRQSSEIKNVTKLMAPQSGFSENA